MSDLNDLNEDARIAYSMYVDHMRTNGIRITRGFDQDSKLWYRLAKRAGNDSLDMVTLMQAQFEEIHDVRSLRPETLTDPKRFDDVKKRYYRQVPETTEETFKQKFRVLLNQLFIYAPKLIPKSYANRNKLLYDINMPFPPWFRILLAVADQEGYQDVLDRYRKSAQEYLNLYCGLQTFLETLEGPYDVKRLR